MTVKVSNICISFNCGCKLDLRHIFATEKNTPIRYNPKKFPGLRVRLLHSRTTALIFGSGYISTSGSKSLKASEISAIEVNEFLKKYEPNVVIANYKVNNICGSITLSPIDITRFVTDHPKISSYEIELFPALKLSFENKIFTIHHNGKIFTTGFKTICEMNIAFNKLHDLLLNYIK